MALITFLSQEEIRNKILNKWKEMYPNINVAEDSQVFMDAEALAEALFSIQVDAFSLAEEAFIPYATRDRLSNLGIERGIPRRQATIATGEVTFSRSTLASSNYVIPEGTEVSTQPDTNGLTVNFKTTEGVILYGSITTPTNVQISTSSSGGALDDTTDYFYKITAVDGLGNETLPSSEVTVTTGSSGDNNSNSITWNAVPNAVSYKVYASTITNTETLLTTTTGAFFTHVTGSGDGVTSPPVSNSTGALSVTVDVEAVLAGGNGNVPVGAISRLIDQPAGVETVVNQEATGGGADDESDQEYRSRMQQAFIFGSTQSKTTKTGYEQTALTVSGVRTATVVNPNSGVNRNEFYIYITSSESVTGLPTNQLLDQVTAVVNDDDNRSPNDLITVLSPTPISLNVDIQTIELDSSFSESDVKNQIRVNVTEYLNGLSTGESVYIVGIMNAIHDTPGVIDFTVLNPSSNYIVDATEKAVAGNITVI